MSWLRARKDSKTSAGQSTTKSASGELQLNEDLWPSVLPAQADVSPSASPTRPSKGDFTLGLEPSSSPEGLTAAPRRIRSNAPVKQSKESSDDSPVENLQARPRKRSRPLPPESSAPARQSRGPVSSGGSDGFAGNSTSPRSAGTQGSHSHEASQGSSGSAGTRTRPQSRYLTPTVPSTSSGSLGRSSGRREPSPVDYLVAENLLLAGRAISRHGSVSGTSVYVTGASDAAPGQGSSADDSDSPTDPVLEEETARHSRGTYSGSSPLSPSLASDEQPALRQTRSLPSLIGGSSTDAGTISDTDSEAEYEDAREGITEEEEDRPPTQIMRVRLALDAAMIYSAGSSPRGSLDRPRKTSFARSAGWLLPPSPEMSPTAMYFPFSAVTSTTDGSTAHGKSPDRTLASTPSTELEVEDDYVELPVPPEPLRSKNPYLPSDSATFLSAPPSRLRRRHRSDAKRRRTVSEGAQPHSRGPIGPYRHPEVDERSLAAIPAAPIRPPSPRMSTSFSWIFSRSSDSRHRRSASKGRSKSTSNSQSTQPYSTFLSQRGPVVRRSPLLERGVRSVWSLSTVQASEGESQHDTDESESTTLRQTTIETLVYALRCVPPTAWLFVFGFLFPPLWWLGSYFPIYNRDGKREYWGATRSSPLLDAASDDRLPRSPPHERISFVQDRTSFRATHTNLLPPQTMSADRLPLPSPVSQFFAEGPTHRIRGEDTTFWATQRSIWRWRLWNRVMSCLSFVVLIPVLVFGILSGTVWSSREGND